jgi:hypothetical protein
MGIHRSAIVRQKATTSHHATPHITLSGLYVEASRVEQVH